jgi:hypothetical protein
MEYVAMKRTTTRDGIKNLPRPKLVQEVLLVGSKQECQDLIDRLVTQPENQSSREVCVELLISVFYNQKSFNSRDILPHSRNKYGLR